jgi:hypothetical protein
VHFAEPVGLGPLTEKIMSHVEGDGTANQKNGGGGAQRKGRDTLVYRAQSRPGITPAMIKDAIKERLRKHAIAVCSGLKIDPYWQRHPRNPRAYVKAE